MNALILRENSYIALQKAINAKIEEGYALSGGITVDGAFYIAVVVKPF